MVKRYRLVKTNFLAHYFVTAQDTTNTTWGLQLMTCHGQVPKIRTFKLLQNTLCEKNQSVSCLNCESMMTGKQMKSKKYLPTVLSKQPTNGWREKISVT
jgi:hypothetical protein